MQVLNIIIFILVIGSANCQTTVSYDEYFKKAREIGINKAQIPFYFKNKINVFDFDKYIELLGPNTKRYLSRYSLNLESVLMISDNIVQGEVVSIEYNADKNAGFHSIYKIKVLNNFKGSIGDTLRIIQGSGIVGDVVVNSSKDFNLYIGRSYLLFLKNAEDAYLERTSYVNDKNRIPILTDRNTYSSSFVIENCFLTENNIVYLGNEVQFNISKIHKTINEINALNFK